MGTRFELVLPGANPAGLRAIGEAALEEIEGCHQRFSRFDESSLLNHLHRHGHRRPVPVDADTWALFQDAAAVWRASDGAFDPTAPTEAMDALALDPRTRSVGLERPGVRFDLGAIAKGHALDLAARVLRAHGITSAFLHGGTSSAIGIGAPPEGEWRVAIGEDAVVTLRDRALSVSAVWDGNPHPTLDPRTGQPVAGPRQVAVVGPGARLADAWSTAALVLGTRPPALGPEWSVIFT